MMSMRPDRSTIRARVITVASAVLPCSARARREVTQAAIPPWHTSPSGGSPRGGTSSAPAGSTCRADCKCTCSSSPPPTRRSHSALSSAFVLLSFFSNRPPALPLPLQPLLLRRLSPPPRRRLGASRLVWSRPGPTATSTFALGTSSPPCPRPCVHRAVILLL